MNDQPKREARKQTRGKAGSEEKRPFASPRVTYVPPKLVKRGDAKQVTAGFFGSFYP